MNAFDSFPLGRPAFVSNILDRAAHLRTNVASLLKPPLPQADQAKLAALFGHLTGIGLDSHQAPAPHPAPR